MFYRILQTIPRSEKPGPTFVCLNHRFKSTNRSAGKTGARRSEKIGCILSTCATYDASNVICVFSVLVVPDAGDFSDYS